MSKNKANGASTAGQVADDNQDLLRMTTRTRSGRMVRRPSGLQNCEVPARTPVRRSRRSIIPEQSEAEQQAPELDEDNPAMSVGQETAKEKSAVSVEQSEPEQQAPKPVEENPAVSVGQETVKEKSSVSVGLETVEEKPAVCVKPGTVADKPAICVEPEGPRLDPAVEVDKAGQVSKPAPVERPPAIPETESHPPKKKRRQRKSVKAAVAIPLGKPKSGRVWKDRNKQRFSALVRDASLCTSWKKKMQAKREKQLVQKYSSQLKEQKAQAKEEKRKRREDNLKRREENERKAEVVQVIRNTAKLKRMKKKQLRKIEKRDTLALLQKSNNNNNDQKKNENQNNNNKAKRAKKSKSANLT
ncbi:coiled-coil domain-containing protein 86 [Hippocampus zosterae]|uniref:coiled-coil domain-containing protein 86 n=1 Tax=Hippocampus zosterae TaxID=109293 RepID=UPI00223C8F58|nr:coiled-coil domain-containing protein 86 [Hippocampus zosterae]